MKKKLIVSTTLSILLFFLFITFSVTYGWYTNVTKIGKIDAETKDITFSYKLNDGEANQFEYSVINLAFFDVDDSSELKYFVKMHTVIKIELENFSSDVVNYSIGFESEKIKTTVDSVDTSIAYIMGVITEDENISITDNGTNTVSTYFEGYDTAKSNYSYEYESKENLAINTGANSEAKATVYLHLIGVQEIDTATNEFLFDSQGNPKGYNFTITIHSEPINDDPVITEIEE